MNYIPRKIDEELQIWRNQPERKLLLLRGARQVGKSSAVRHLAKSFDHFIEVNFDENPSYAALFQQSLSPREVCEQLSLLTQTPIVEGKTLVFFDEIQSCIPAISALRYFYEKMPALHVIAAGSLLEFALSEVPSYGVGRVRSLFLYPFSFQEFLLANGESGLIAYVTESGFAKALPDLIHEKLINYLKKFLVIGGMPEAVSSYVLQGNMLEVQRILDDLVISIEADFAKFRNRVPAIRIREVFNSVVQQVGNKFTYTFGNSSLTILQVKQALDLLTLAGLIYPVTHSSCNGLPLGAEINVKKRKFLLFDTGIFQRILGLNIAELLLENDFSVINKGNMAELYVGLEWIKNTSCYENWDLHYWQRESKNAQSEVDYVVQNKGQILPIEVKSGTKGAMQSMHLFLQEKNLKKGIRTSLENFGQIPNVQIIPLYAIGMYKVVN
jgi:predicted AAA+ superfamily ATPase